MLANKIDYGIRRDPQLSGALKLLCTEGSRFNQLLEAVTTYAEPFRHLASGISAANELWAISCQLSTCLKHEA